MTPKSVRLPVALGLALVLFATSALACGPFALEAIFVHTVHPTYPLERFVKGEIGVLQPSFARSYLFVAYRYLAGSGFTEPEQTALAELWRERLYVRGDLGSDEWTKAWIETRQKVKGVPKSPDIDVYRNREKPNEYESYLNCQKDSFDNAIKTLNARIEKYGVDNAIVRTWVEGQDQVFSNCSEGQHIPSPLDASADVMARADRAYQIAAANFYSTNFDQAVNDFEAIATDKDSPWSGPAPYMIARALIRKASLGAAETRTESLTQAEARLRKILDDNKLAYLHAAASRLMDLVELRLHPERRLQELARNLVAKNNNPRLKQDLWDYTVLLDGVLESTDKQNKKNLPADLRSDDLTDWIVTLQDSSDAATVNAIAKWEQTKQPAWLIAALSKVKGQDRRAPELISQASKVKPTSTAFASARFHAVRLLVESGKMAEGRALLDQLLKNNRAQFDQSSWNLLVSQRMMLATSLADFLNYVPRKPASLSWNDDGREVPVEDADVSEENKSLLGKSLFDVETSSVINKQLPLSALKEAALTSTLPANLKRDLVQAVWLRAVILDDNETAVQLVPILKSVLPGMSQLLDDFLSAPQPDSKKFAAIYAWLKFPGLEPVVDLGISRQTSLDQQDIYRDNWWCGAAYTAPNPDTTEEPEIPSFTGPAKGLASFLTAAERTQARQQRARLEAIGAAPNYLCRQVVQWGTSNPNDPRVPEALHLAVTSTRYGCTDQNTGRWSKAAFDLLHKKYPNSPWARKTPYWFKD